MINLDPSIVDQETLRKTRRKKLMLIALLPIILLVAGGVFLLRPGIFDILYRINYNANNSNVLVSISEMQKFANIIEPYIADYSAGTAYIKSGDGKRAETELRNSISKNPPSDKICQVRTNLAYSIEMQGDSAKDSGNHDEALIFYNRAEGVLLEDNCASKQDGKKGSDEKAETAKQRISKKRSETVAAMNNISNNDSDDNNSGTEINESTLQELRGKLVNGNKVRGTAEQKKAEGRRTDTLTEHW